LSPVSSIWPQLDRLVPFGVVVDWLAYVRATAPVIKPAIAAPATNAFVDLFINYSSVGCLVGFGLPFLSRQAGTKMVSDLLGFPAGKCMSAENPGIVSI
jgi:hypothetical protein